MKKLHFRFSAILHQLGILALALMFFAFAGLAAEPVKGANARFIDETGTLSSEETSYLVGLMDEISQRQSCDVLGVMVNSLGGMSADAYAREYFLSQGFGQGEEKSGVVMVVSLGDSEYGFYTEGYANSEAFEYYLDDISERAKSYLSGGDFLGAFRTYAQLSDEYLTLSAQGIEPGPTQTERGVLRGGIAAAVGAIAGWLGLGGQKAALTSVHQQSGARTYLRQNSLNLTDTRETFLYNQVTRTRKVQPREGGRPMSGMSGTGNHGSGHGGKF